MSSRTEPLTCERCGIEFTITVAALQQRRARGVTKPNCPDCETLDKPITGYYNECRGWMGEVDEFDRPIRNGKLWKPGIRNCGRADCVRLSHITPQPPEIPQKSPVSVSKPVRVSKRVTTAKPAPKPPKAKPAPKLPKAFLDALEAERHDQTYKGEPKRTLNQLKKAVERERYRIPPR